MARRALAAAPVKEDEAVTQADDEVSELGLVMRVRRSMKSRRANARAIFCCGLLRLAVLRKDAAAGKITKKR
jgi:hypothetical protein